VKEVVKTSPDITLANLLASESQLGANDIYAMLVIDIANNLLLRLQSLQFWRSRLDIWRDWLNINRNSPRGLRKLKIAEVDSAVE
jgi:hypothetical protein